MSSTAWGERENAYYVAMWLVKRFRYRRDVFEATILAALCVLLPSFGERRLGKFARGEQGVCVLSCVVYGRLRSRRTQIKQTCERVLRYTLCLVTLLDPRKM